MAENTTTATTEAEAANTLNDERARRLADRAALYAAGKNPYPEHSDVTDRAADLLERYAGLANEEEAAGTRSCSSSCATLPPTSSSSAA